MSAIGAPYHFMTLRTCLRDPVPEIFTASRQLDAAVTAHLAGQKQLADDLIRAANIPEIRLWTESLWGSDSPYVIAKTPSKTPTCIPKEQRVRARMPNADERRILHQRDGFHCRFCGIPVIRKETRQRIKAVYPDALPWGKRNIDQHAAFQAMWLQYDHLLPHARGGTNALENIVITCAPCNYARMNRTLEEVGLMDPRDRHPIRSSWDGLGRFK